MEWYLHMVRMVDTALHARKQLPNAVSCWRIVCCSILRVHCLFMSGLNSRCTWDSFILDRFLRSLSRPSISTDPALLLAKLSRMFRSAFQTMSTVIGLKVMNEMNMHFTAVILARVADRVARVNSLQRIRPSSLSF